jgi:hypothetical protein
VPGQRPDRRQQQQQPATRGDEPGHGQQQRAQQADQRVADLRAGRLPASAADRNARQPRTPSRRSSANPRCWTRPGAAGPNRRRRRAPPPRTQYFGHREQQQYQRSRAGTSRASSTTFGVTRRLRQA